MADEAKGDEVTETQRDGDKVNERRRALIQAGWTVPIITSAAGLPSNAAFAQSPHADATHNDAIHADAPHNDVVHSDAPHSDVHGDAPSSGHGDAHDDVTVLHIDIPHADIGGIGTPHADTAFAHGDSHSDTPAFP